MQTKWILLCIIAAIALVVIVVPLAVPGLTPAGIVQGSEATAGDGFMLVNQSGIALSLYNDALASDPGNTVLLKKKAEALLRSGKTGESEQIYRQLLIQIPNAPDVQVRMGDFAFRNGDYPGAVGYYDAALLLQPKNAQILLREGDAYLSLAVTQYHEQHAVFLDSLDSYRKAMTVYAQAEKLDPRLSAVVSARTLAADQFQASGDEEGMLASLGAFR